MLKNEGSEHLSINYTGLACSFCKSLLLFQTVAILIILPNSLELSSVEENYKDSSNLILEIPANGQNVFIAILKQDFVKRLGSPWVLR